MPDRVFHIVDVFAETPCAGNQLAVFLNGEQYSDAEMQKLAQEMNYSETTFIMAQEQPGATFKVRIFTPSVELPFAGHPTLGSAYIAAKELLGAALPEVVLDLAAGQIPVAITYDAAGAPARLTMRQLPPTFGRTLDAPTAAAMLGLPDDAVDTRYPVQEVSTGVPFLLAPLRALAAVQGVQVDVPRMRAALAGFVAGGVLVFCAQTAQPENDLHARMFAPLMGIAEDPATGSANGCLVGYLLQHGVLGGPTLDARVEQGFEMGRPSILYLTGRLQDGAFTIQVGGKVQHIARGTLL